MIFIPMEVILLIFLQFIFRTGATNPPAQCVHLRNDIFADCTKRGAGFATLLANQKTDKDITKKSGEVCMNEKICRKNFKLTTIRRQLYTLSIFRQFAYVLENCCGNCSSYQVLKYGITRLEQLNKTIFETSDIIFPLLATKSVDHMYGFHYIPILEVPSAYYFTLKRTREQNMLELIVGILSTWPLIVICILMAFLSGFVIWVMERKANTDEFPRPMREGLSEGFWWSFVSMTTVGYGDKSPRTLKGRLFAVLWILIGITIFAILTGSLTNQISRIHSHPVPELTGKKVGGLSHKFHESTMVAQHGGSLKAIHFNNTVRGIGELIGKLERGEIDGFLISRPSYYYFSKALTYKENKDVADRVKNVELERSEKRYIGEKLTLGMLVKDFDAYNYFKSYFEDNYLQIQDCNSFKLNNNADKYASEESSHFGGLFYTFLYIILVLILLVILFGIVKEIIRRHKISKGNVEENGNLNETKDI